MWVASPYVKLQADDPAGALEAAARRAARRARRLPAGRRRRPDGAAASRAACAGPAARGCAAPPSSVLRELTVPVTARSSAVAHGSPGRRPRSARAALGAAAHRLDRARSSGSRSQCRARCAQAPTAAVVQVGDVARPLPPARRRRDAARGARALHTWFLVWSAHADDAEHHRDAGRRVHARARPLRRRRRHRGRRRRGHRRPARQLAARRLGRDAAATRTRGRRRRGPPAGAACPMSCPTPTSSTSRRATSSARCAAGATRSRREAPGVRQLVTATTDPSLGRTRRRLGDAPRCADARRRSRRRMRSAPRPGSTRRAASRRASPTLLLDQHAVGNLAVAPASWLQGGGRPPLLVGQRLHRGSVPRRRATTATRPARIGNGDGVLLYPGPAARPAGAESVAAPRARRRRPADRRRGGVARAPRPRRRGPGAARARAPGHGRVRRQPGVVADRRARAPAAARATRDGTRPRHVLMVADIDLAYPDARRVHVTEIARGLVAAGCEVELVSRGPDPGIAGVRYARRGRLGRRQDRPAGTRQRRRACASRRCAPAGRALALRPLRLGRSCRRSSPWASARLPRRPRGQRADRRSTSHPDAAAGLVLGGTASASSARPSAPPGARRTGCCP